MTMIRQRMVGTTQLTLAAILPLGCSGSGLDVDTSRTGGHGSFDGIELASVELGQVLAVWSRADGWSDPSGRPLRALPASVKTVDGLAPLHVGGAPAALEIRVRGPKPLDITPRSPFDPTGDNPCREFSVRYFPLDDNTQVIVWPNLPRADQPDGPALFAERPGGEQVQLFYCNQVRIYPLRAGSVTLEWVLWHVNHADQATDPLAVEVTAP